MIKCDDNFFYLIERSLGLFLNLSGAGAARGCEVEETNGGQCQFPLE